MRRKCGITQVRQHRLTNKYHKEKDTILKKGSIQEEDLILISIYTPNVGVCKYIKQIATNVKGEIDGEIRVGDLNTPLTSMDKFSRQKTSKARDPKQHNRITVN